MKHIAIALILLTLIIGCGTRKDAKLNDQSEIISDGDVDGHLDDLNDVPLMDDNGAIKTSGIIRDKSSENCGFLVEIIVEEVPKLFEPLELDSAFCVEGMSVDIIYHFSRRPSNCLVALPIIIEEIVAK